METKSIEKVIRLLTKAGLFFAKADGAYDQRETDFINNFTAKLAEAGGDAAEAKRMVSEYSSHAISLEEVIADTKDLLDDFDANESATISLMLTGFIEQVINADGVESKPERELYDKWLQAIV